MNSIHKLSSAVILGVGTVSLHCSTVLCPCLTVKDPTKQVRYIFTKSTLVPFMAITEVTEMSDLYRMFLYSFFSYLFLKHQEINLNVFLCYSILNSQPRVLRFYRSHQHMLESLTETSILYMKVYTMCIVL